MSLLNEVVDALGGVPADAAAIPWAQPGEYYEWWRSTDPLSSTVLLCGAVVLYCFVAAVATGNYSKTDQVWSIVPAVYVWNYYFFALAHGREPGRLALMASLATLWAARLTFNFARKGGFSGEEDYRWLELRRIIPNPVLWQLFNAGFIAGYQNVLLLWIALPADLVYRANAPVNPADLGIAAAWALFFIGETLADEQQWEFQSIKHSKDKLTAKQEVRAEQLKFDLKRGFISSGLFRFSRHPNFFCEQAMWVTFSLFGVAAGGPALSYASAGAAQLVLLFQGSTRFTEGLTLRRNPRYVEYQATTSMLLPWWPRPAKAED